MVTITTSDNKIFNVKEEIIFQSNLIKNMLSELESTDDQIIPLPNVNSSTLEKILKYMEHHKDDEGEVIEEPKQGERDSTIHDVWDRDFIDIPEENLEQVILAANYLDIKNLLTLSCKKVANIIKDKSVDEIREYFGLEKPTEDDEYKGEDNSPIN